MQATRVERETAKSSAVRTQSAKIIHGSDTTAGQYADGEAAQYPVISKGKGATVTDVDGNDYVDFDAAGGSVLLGHADERIVAAITKAVAKGHGFSGPSEALVRLAELIVSRFPAMEGLTVASTRREALHAAADLALRATGRSLILACERHPLQRIPGLQDALHTVPYNDAAAVERIFDQHKQRIAAFIIEPVATSIGLVAPADGFLGRLRALCDRHGTLLIYDETATGLRLGAGGAARLFAAAPDVTCLGGSLSAGLPLAVIGGRAELVKALPAPADQSHAPSRPSELAVAAALASLQASADAGFYEELDETAGMLEQDLRDAVQDAGGGANISRVCSLLGVFLAREGVRNWATAQPADACSNAAFRAAVLDGRILPPGPYRPWAVMSAHTESQFEQTAKAVADAVRRAAT